MKTPPPLRNYKQMVRVVRDNDQANTSSSVPYQLGNAYGNDNPSPVETRERTLDENGINSRTPRQPESAGLEGYLSARETSSQFHKLDDGQQQYFTGTNPNPAPSRQDSLPGTKSRAYLSSDNEQANSERVLVTEEKDKKTQQRKKPNPPEHKPVDLHFKHEGHENAAAAAKGKQTNLPVISKSSLSGTAGSKVSINTYT